MISESLKKEYLENGYIVVNDLLTPEELKDLVTRREEILRGEAKHIAASQVVTRFSAQSLPILHKIRGLAETDDLYKKLATSEKMVNIIEGLLNQEALIFRDVMVVKPSQAGAAFSWHQDSAYWDVDPPALISAWVALDDAPEASGCLRVIKGSHQMPIEHDLFLNPAKPLPRPITQFLRRMVSLAGTGDNPSGAGGSAAMDYLKRLVLGKFTKILPSLDSLNDFKVDNVKIAQWQQKELAVPVKAGSVIFFHSLLLHASSPNKSASSRSAEIISYMGKDFKFTGRGNPNFLPARSR